MYVEMNRKPVLRGFGQSASERPAVRKLQLALQLFAIDRGDMDYHPGRADGKYGLNTHAAIIRVSRDFLEPDGAVSGTCRSTCNTLASSARSFCKDCLARMLAHMAGTKLPGLSLSPQEIDEIVDAYGEFLDSYVARYGEHGETDPRQIARREGVDMEEAVRLAAERAGTAPDGGGVTVTPVVVEEIPGGGPSMRASFPWAAVILIGLLVGGAAVGSWYYMRRGEEGVRTPPEPPAGRGIRRASRPW